MKRPDRILTPSPWGRGNHHLWGLRYETEDDRFIQIIRDISGLIYRSEKRCDAVEDDDNREYREFVVDSECEYLEEIIGASFLVLQTKIRRVYSSALSLKNAMLNSYEIRIDGFENPKEIMSLEGAYQPGFPSLIELIWHVGNYYKHRDEWGAEVWESKLENRRKAIGHQLRTCQVVQKMGIVQFSTGNMRRAYEFFGIEPYSNCAKIAEQVQDWATMVYQVARAELEAKTRQTPRQ